MTTRADVSMVGSVYRKDKDDSEFQEIYKRSKKKRKDDRHFTLYRVNNGEWYSFRKDLDRVIKDGDYLECYRVDNTTRGVANLLNFKNEEYAA